MIPTIYASTDPVTLNTEAYYKGLHYGWTKADFKAQLILGIHWELQALVDLTSSAPESDEYADCELRLARRAGGWSRTGDAGDCESRV